MQIKNEDTLKKANQIKLIIFDVDGVLTDGKIYYSDKGEELKAFNTQDGFGIKKIVAMGLTLAIITGRQSPIVDKRAKELGINIVYQGQSNKLIAYNDCIEKLNITSNEVAYMGDDVNDLPVMKEVAISIAPPNAVDDVLDYVDIITKREGGYGAARELCDFFIKNAHK